MEIENTSEMQGLTEKIRQRRKHYQISWRIELLPILVIVRHIDKY
jgi:hypothetical protein